jgi:hypothetical protein
VTVAAIAPHTVAAAYAPRRTRRTPEQMEACRTAICEILKEVHPITLRGLYYQMVSKGIIGKTENDYDKLGRMLCQLRKDGRVPWAWIVDNTRGLSVPNTFYSVGNALETIHNVYRRDPWEDQDATCYVMCEKDAIAGILSQETRPYCVPVAVVRGYSSITFLHEIAVQMEESGKPAHVFYFGDHDPSGENIEEVSERSLREFGPKAEIYFHRLGVTKEQIAEYDLPTRPTKKTDGRIKNFKGKRSVEVDALPMDVLRGLTRNAIESQLDREAYVLTMERERIERQELADLVERYEATDEGEESEGEDDEG